MKDFKDWAGEKSSLTGRLLFALFCDSILVAAWWLFITLLHLVADWAVRHGAADDQSAHVAHLIFSYGTLTVIVIYVVCDVVETTRELFKA